MRFLLHTVHFLYKVVKYPVWSGNIEGEMHMEIQILPLIIVVAYLVGMLVVGAVVSKVQIKNAKDYMVAGRRMGLFMVAFSQMCIRDRGPAFAAPPGRGARYSR